MKWISVEDRLPELIEGNKIIAKFMGLKYGWWISQEKPLTDDKKQWCDLDGKTFLGSKVYYNKDLLFHSSWDWLMPVVEKIYKMYKWDKFYYNPSMAYFYLSTKIKIYVGSKDHDFGTCGTMEYKYIKGDDNILYKAVIEFIKWYNSQTQQPLHKYQTVIYILK